MKLNFKPTLIAALAMTTLLASCSKEDGGKMNDGETRTVQISISQASPAARSVGGQVADGATVTFTSGQLLFANGVDAITMMVTIAPGSAAYDASTKTVGVDALEAAGGAWITGVPGASTKVYFVGNVPAGVVPALNGKVSDLVAAVASQWKSDGGVDNVTLFGGETLAPSALPGAQADEYTAKFIVKPLVGRFEIGAVTGTGDVSSFKIDGIFMDNYYNTMNLNGTAIPADLKQNGTTAALYVMDAAGSTYTTAMHGMVFDYDATSGLTAPGSGNAWAYNLLAPTSASPAMPVIVVKLSDVVVNGENWPSPQFLTVSNFYSDAGVNTVSIDKMDQGRIYLIPDLEFDETNLTPEPYLKSKRVAVEIEMMNWESDPIGYDFD